VLLRQGERVTAIYFVEAGRLRLERQTFDGRSLVVGTTSSGRFFVEAALFADIFHCDAVATEPSQVRIYPKSAVLNALRADPDFVYCTDVACRYRRNEGLARSVNAVDT
jgi:CRP-like cAMP-binding protein